MSFAAAILLSQAAATVPTVATAQPVTNAQVTAGSVSDDDYPSAVLRARLQGRSLVRFLVDARGRPTQCAVAQSSGNEALDSRTCDIARRFRFRPARDASGQAVAQAFLFQVEYRIPRNLAVQTPYPEGGPDR